MPIAADGVTDALGNSIDETAWYGYSKESSGVVTVIRARVKYVKDDKLRLTDVREYRSYGNHGWNGIVPQPGNDRTVSARILFPIQPQS